MRKRRPVVTWSVALGMVALGACSDDDDASEATVPPAVTAETSPATTAAAPSTTATSTTATPSTPETTETTEATNEAASEQFCSTVVEAEAVASAGPDVDFEAATEEEVAAAMEEFSAALLPMLDQLAADVPEEIASDLETIDSALRGSIESGEDPFGQPGFVEADRAVDEYVADNCGFEIYTVRAVDYAFEDVPDTIEAGIVGFDLENDGREVHEMVLFRINDDVDLSIQELTELPEEESQSMVEFVTVAFAAPGESDITFHDLRPGRYGMLCFIPLGTTDMSILEGEPSGEATGDATGGAPSTTEATSQTADMTTDSSGPSEMGPPHFTQGMMAEFEVVEAGSGGGSTSPSTTDGSDSSMPTTTTGSGAATTSTTNDTDSSAPSTTSG